MKEKKEKIVVFGVGRNWKQCASYIDTQYEVVALIDNNWQTVGGENEVLPVESIKNLEYDKVLIFPTKTEDMIAQLLEMHIPHEKIEIFRFESRKLYRNTLAGPAYGQWFDDMIAAAIFAQIEIDKPTYLDLGANHPIFCSNTMLFYSNGCRGVNVEPNPYLIEAFKEERPEDINLNVGISTRRGKLPFYMFDFAAGINTFSKEELENRKRGGFHVVETVELPVITLEDVIDKYCGGVFPDFLDCDIEGLDFAVLSTYDLSKNGPKVACVEVNPDEEEMFDDLFTNYDYFKFCRMEKNVFYVRNEYKSKLWWEVHTNR